MDDIRNYNCGSVYTWIMANCLFPAYIQRPNLPRSAHHAGDKEEGLRPKFTTQGMKKVLENDEPALCTIEASPET